MRRFARFGYLTAPAAGAWHLVATVPAGHHWQLRQVILADVSGNAGRTYLGAWRAGAFLYFLAELVTAAGAVAPSVSPVELHQVLVAGDEIRFFTAHATNYVVVSGVDYDFV